jgi:hypothetical protein
LAVVLAVIRTPFWPLLPAFAIALGGFAFNRAGGGNGIAGATVAGLVTFAAFGVVILPFSDRSMGSETEILLISLFFFVPIGIVFGFVVGFSAFWLLYVRDDIRRQAGSRTARAGGRPP